MYIALISTAIPGCNLLHRDFFLKMYCMLNLENIKPHPPACDKNTGLIASESCMKRDLGQHLQQFGGVQGLSPAALGRLSIFSLLGN